MRGFLYVFEAVLAGIVIATFLIVVGRTVIVAPKNPVTEGYAILEGLDEQGLLRNYTVNLDWSALNSRVKVWSYNHSIEICDYAGSCVGQKPNYTNIWVSTYFIAGQYDYNPYTVKLYLWGD